MFRRTFIPWLQLKHERIKLLVAIAGIGFAVVLIFMQLGFQAALFDSSVRLHSSLKGDLFLLSPRSTALIAMKSFSQKRLYQVLKFKEVEFIAPIYLGFAHWRNPDNPAYWRNIQAIGFDLSHSIFALPEIEQHLKRLQQPDVVLFDRASRPEFGEIIAKLERDGLVSTEIDSPASETRRIEVVGLFTLGTSFGVDGNIITSHLNFLRIFTHRQKGAIEVGLIKLKPGTDLARLKQKIAHYLPPDIKVFSKQEWIDFEKEYWTSSTAIGFIFSLGVAMGLIVGVVVVYQILYTDVVNHLKEYATLKAMGYRDRYLLSLVLQEAMILALLGYIPGFLIASGLYSLAREATLLPIAMNPGRSLFVLLLTFLMCFFSGSIAMRKLQDADPADIF